jgi:RES domain-containing protein
MNGLPPPLGQGGIEFWRLDKVAFAATWDSGEGARLAGGRWNPKDSRAVYCSLDPATAILEVAVHAGFANLDQVPRILTHARVTDPADVLVVMPEDVPNPNWLVPSFPTAGQQAFGAGLTGRRPFVVLPSVISRQSWNLVFDPAQAAGRYTVISQTRFAFDPRLAPLT